MIYFLFGKPGAGKSTVGRSVAQTLYFPYLDCDDLYTQEDRARIRVNTFTIEESDAFLTRVIGALQKYHEQRDCIIASQSLFRQAQRDDLMRVFSGDLKFIYLEVDDKTCLQRLGERQHILSGLERESSFYTAEHFSQESHEYEIPHEADLWIENNGFLEDVVQKLIQYINST